MEFTKKMWQGRMFACRGVGASTISDEDKEQFMKEHGEFLSQFSEPLVIPHYITVLDFMKKV